MRIYKPSLAGYAFLLLPLVSAPLQADVALVEEYQHYQIAPDTVTQIKRELRERSPISRANQTFHGETQWTLVPNFRWAKHHNLCRIEDVHVQLNGTYLLPELVRDRETDSQTRTHFARYYEALLSHEKGHQDLWLEAGHKIERTLLEFEPFFDCRMLAQEAKTRVSAIIEEYRQKNRAYDQQTGHGRTQGAAIQ